MQFYPFIFNKTRIILQSFLSTKNNYNRNYLTSLFFSTKNESHDISILMPDFPQPGDIICCGSGCQNCVWIQYSDAVNNYLLKNNEKIKYNLNPNETIDQRRKKIIEKVLEKHVEDINFRMYILMNIPFIKN